MGFDDDDEGPPFFHHKSRYDLNSKIMLTAIISLSVVVFVVTVLHVYARCILRRQARRHAAALHQMMIAAAEAHAHSGVEPPNTGLHPSVIASLPISVFKKTAENESVECSVCLSVVQDGEMARNLPNCHHIFHAECIDKWFIGQSTCPVCRTEVEPREGAVGVVVPPPPPPPPPTAPPMEGTSDGGAAAKVSGSSSSSFRLSSFRKILSRERSSRRIQSCGGGEDGIQDLERQ